MKWISNGCIRIDGIDYVYGDTIPVKKLKEERVKELQVLGKIGELPTPKEPSAIDSLDFQNKNLKTENSDLLKRNEELMVELEKLKVEHEELIKTKGGKQVKARIEELQAQNEEFFKEIGKVTANNDVLKAELKDAKKSKE